MSVPNYKPLVMVVGASGLTGKVIVEALLRQNSKFRVAAVARSASKPILVDFKSRGVIIHELDQSTASFEELKEVLKGVDVLITPTHYTLIMNQKELFRAAKAVGVKRVVPNDFATSAPPGVIFIHDQKLAIRDYLREIQQPATFIEVGYWKQLVTPFPASRVNDPTAQVTYVVYGSGDVATATTNYFNVGDHVARIIQDDRTINQTVFVWEAEVTKNQVWEIAKRKCDDWPALEKLRVNKTAEELEKLKDKATVDNDILIRLVYEYPWSKYVRGDNTVKNAVSLGALDVQKLYPDISFESFEEFTDDFYRNPPTLY